MWVAKDTEPCAGVSAEGFCMMQEMRRGKFGVFGAGSFRKAGDSR